MKRKATGIVRRIDDLGRVVIPKEIRRVMNLREGDPVEFYIENDKDLMLVPYSPVSNILANNKNMFRTAMHSTGLNAQLYMVSPYEQWDTAPDPEMETLAKPILKRLRNEDDAPCEFIKADDDKNNIHLTIMPLYQPDMMYLGSIVVRHVPGDNPAKMDACLNMVRSICVWELEKGN